MPKRTDEAGGVAMRREGRSEGRSGEVHRPREANGGVLFTETVRKLQTKYKLSTPISSL